MANRTCAAPNCDRQAPYRGGGGLCSKHWQRWRRHGDVDTIAIPPQNIARPPRPCAIAGCRSLAVTRGWCDMHYTRWIRHGDPEAPHGSRVPDSELTYRALHKRVVNERGPASSQACVDCQQPASQWSYQAGQPDEMVSPAGMPYSPNVNAYVPRCVSCHKRLDDPNPVGLKYRWANR